METHLSFDRMEEKDCHNNDLMRHSALENGKMTRHIEDFEVVSTEGVGKGADLCPMTPVPCRKKGESGFVMSTPLSVGSPRPLIIKNLDSTSSNELVGYVCDESPRTPKEGVFNPFAPGPEELCRAPFCKKVVKKSRKIVARRLDFDDVDKAHTSTGDDKDAELQLEKMLWEMVYETFLEAILLKQTEDFLAENRDLELEGCKTPTSPLPLNGISETCPDPPAKGTGRKSLNIDPGLCRKLEF